ncbi:MAG: hypothetical protein O3A46_10650 [Candidatus Poribacteria bacterium]|nr:hypothetical protein [Candidatus Poribacteria bacterium]
MNAPAVLMLLLAAWVIVPIQNSEAVRGPWSERQDKPPRGTHQRRPESNGVPPYKSPTDAMIYALTPPGLGLGHFYIGDTRRGLRHAGLTLISLIALLTAYERPYDDDAHALGRAIGNISNENVTDAAQILFIANAIWAAIDAPRVAKRQNLRREELLRQQRAWRLELSPRKGRGVVALTHSF